MSSSERKEESTRAREKLLYESCLYVCTRCRISRRDRLIFNFEVVRLARCIILPNITLVKFNWNISPRLQGSTRP
jgi:hypothetical protein